MVLQFTFTKDLKLDNHHDFIFTPIHIILNDVVTANAGIGYGIETFPLGEYVLQSAFLKMTGFQEQKMKCMCWELATHDYEYRYERFSQKPLGECSSYEEKKTIYKDLIKQIRKHQGGFNISSILNQDEIRLIVHSRIVDIFHDTNISTWTQHSFHNFEKSTDIIKSNQFGGTDNLLESQLQSIYNQLYVHRNRCAHNTLSYQQNLPTLQVMSDSKYVYDDYFVRFSVLLLVDEIFIRLFRNFLAVA